MSASFLEARRVRMEFGGGLFERQRLVAVQGASLQLPADRPVVVAIAGESGSGKTTLARLLLGMIPPTSGSILYQGTELKQLDRSGYQVFRRQVQAVFQDPFGVFNPFYRVDHSLELPVSKFFPKLTRDQRRERIEEGLRAVGLRAEETLGRYPHQLSGGQRQRIMVTRALLLDPKVIVADEPVSMVDASLRATILESLFRIHRERNISLVYITHDLTTAYQLSHTILIMYRGDVVEVGDVEQVIKAPRHPYTQLLVRSIPLADTKRRWGEDPDGEPAPSQGGAGPETTEQALSLANGTGGCPFADRCPHVMASCQQTNPSLVLTDPGRAAACHLYEEAPALSAEQIATLSHGGTEGT
ncbi:MAG: ABC transporter ATP-binding protein [Candidatus Latescibacterota bacterium]|nr:ABC transporter ATP-binding protein [Candidatus Latescibacterota bacterium]